MESSSHKGPGLYEFLVEAELQQYYTKIKSDLKIQNTSQLKYVTDDDLYQLEMSKPEVRRLKKYFNKYYPQNYLSKFKKMLLPKKDDQGPGCLMPSVCDPNDSSQHDRLMQCGTAGSGGGPRVPNKHIISAENIVVNKELGMGEFGVVQQGVWTNDGDRIQVAIKCLSRERMQSNPIEFLKEAAIMHSIDHEHVVRLYGVVLHTDSLMLVTELAPLRSLLECLKEPSLRSSFPVLTLCDFALQICDGMQYLEAKRLIHRDLAARNILVFSKNKVKISDFGLSRALGQGKDYYQTNFNVHLKLPIAWCAPECISYLRFTSASDVWAYGVTLWEMFSYGFQPWAALTGHQILEAIDEPNFQRLDQPECCPKDYFTIMLRCWAHEPSKRPTFAELMTMLPECRPEQLQAIMNTPQEFSNAVPPDSNQSLNQQQAFMKREYLQYKVGDVITVLDKGAGPNLWKGILPNGKTGLFNPAHTVAYIGTNLPTSNKPVEVFSRADNKYGSTRRKLRTEMISSPQGDLKHTGHVGLDGAYFGDLSFLGGSGGSSDEKHNTLSQYNHLPRQIVAPYRPHEDLDQTPLLGSSANSNTFMTPNTPPPSSHATSIPPNHSNLHASDHIVVSSRQLQHLSGPPGNETNLLKNLPTRSSGSYRNKKQEPHQTVTADTAQADHEYHEISDEENLVNESPRFEKAFDFGPSLLDEMESMFRNLNSPVLSTPNSPLDHDGVNKCNELRELTSRLGNTNISGNSHTSRSSKKQATVKPISAHDQKILESHIELTTEMTARSMNALDGDPLPITPASPNKRKFSFRFPAGGSGSSEADGSKTERRNFSEEAQAIPDLQSTLTEEAQLAYESLVQTPTPSDTSSLTAPFLHSTSATTATGITSDNPLRMLRSGNLPLIKSRIRTVATLPPSLDRYSSSHHQNQLKYRSRQSQSTMLTTIAATNDCTDGNNITSTDLLHDDDDVFAETKDQDTIIHHPKNHPSSSVSDESNCGDHAQDTQQSPPSYSEFQHQRDENNPIPLPPRDRTKPKLATKPRHTRKHPLIIPASSIQRRLNKVNVTTPTDETTPTIDPLDKFDFSENPIKIIPDGKMCTVTAAEPPYINHNPFKQPNILDTSTTIEHHIGGPSPFDDTHSVNFEAQIESNLAALDELSPQQNEHEHFNENDAFNFPAKSIDTVDGHARNNFDENQTKPFLNNKIIDYRASDKEEKPKNINIHVIYSKKVEKVSPLNQKSNEIFSGSGATDEILRHKTDHVSCEDLLEFADSKPSSRARGIESDEVRIMSKVLGTEVSSQQCLLALEHSNWDVHKAIKLAKLQNLLKISLLASHNHPAFVDLTTCNGALEANQWDLTRAANWIVAANQDGDITQV